MSTIIAQPEPYYSDRDVTLYLGDCRKVLPAVAGSLQVDACVTDPPYGETAAAWDVWPDGWVDAVGAILPASASLWSFGSARMFLDHRDDFTSAGYRFGQEALWVKRNGSGPGSRDRLTKVHEWAYHWYRGKWSDLHHDWERTAAAADKGVVRRVASAAAHQRERRTTQYVDDGTRQPQSVTFVIESPSVRYQKRHQDEKPLACTVPLVRECVPPGGTVLDPFLGSGTTAVAAQMLGLHLVGIEADEQTLEIAAQRMQQGVLADMAPHVPDAMKWGAE